MTPGADWHDPFAEDQYAIERERRRAEREARRRGRQQSLGEKVAEAQAPAVTPGTPEQPAVATAAPATSEQAAAPPTGEQVASPPTGEQPAAVPPAVDGAAVQPVAPRRRRSYRGRTVRSTRSLRIRQLIGVLIIAAVAAGLVFVVSEVIDRIDGAGEPIAPPPVAKTQDLTIPEGLDRRQIADLAKKDLAKGDYLEATKKPPKGFRLARYGAEDAPSLEGFLFPATYELPKKATAKDLVTRQLDAFEQNIEGVDMKYAESKNLSVYDVLKIASMVEREVAVPKERPLVAEVIYNRLAAGDFLGIDATIRYEDQNYDEPLTESRLGTDTPYNTRTRAGLPPTPIGNPGLDSIEAAANPAKGDLYYFVVKPGSCNEHVFVETQEEFDQAQASYQQALEEQGGSPVDCG